MRSDGIPAQGRHCETVRSEGIESRLKLVKERIEAAALACGRDPEDVKLVAVSKTVPVDDIRAAIKVGVRTIGENYVQEAQDKIEALRSERVSWHFIGHLQSKKSKYAVKLFDLIHSVDSLKVAKELDKRAGAIAKVQKVLIQVNISGETTKFGIDAEQAVELIRRIAPLENLTICGLMTMPPYFNAPDKVRPYFKALKALQHLIRNEAIANVHMEELSMGMSGDFETAIEEGATIVRIGTAIFGERA
ncbi:MAG: YggS family pyridoxal phosphate-dependent enzyme [Desulfobacterales bacterium]|nr:YggS family pyridoxal phosphate-dependent enzyme [Desulfobacterales bacterium]